MFETYNTPRYEIMAITTMQALNYYKAPTGSAHKTQNGSETQGSAGQSLTIGQAEKMLKVLVEEGWFEKSAKGYYSLSPRALMELRGWLEDTYNDAEDEDDDENRVLKIKQCFACKELITVVSGASPGNPGRLCFANLNSGSAMPGSGLPMPTPRHLPAELFPHAKIHQVPFMPNGLD